jgi:amidohydrolase
LNLPHARSFVSAVAAATALALANAVSAAPAAGAADAAPLKDEVGASVDAMYPWLDGVYKDLHAHPEIAFQEVRTAGKLAAEMRKLGFEVTEKVGRTGVVALLRNGAGPTVLVRTELDGLPMEEKTGLPYASRAHATMGSGGDARDTFVTHSCGHDVHMAAWLGAARTLAGMKGQWHGTLMFIAQPAEETGGGARAMLDDGLFKRFPKPDVAFALHSWPLAYGTIGFNSGAVSSNADTLEIVFKGRGGHGSAPDKTIDPITIAAHFVVDVQTVVSREKDPKEFGVVTIGAIQGGTVGNIIPDTVLVRGTIRSYSDDVRAKLLDGVRRAANASAALAGAPAPEVRIAGTGAAIINDDALVRRTEAVLQDAFGAQNAQRMPAMTASEDFSAFVNEGVPSMFFFTGIYDPQALAASRLPGAQPLGFNHAPNYAPVPEPSIKTAAEAMSLVVLNALAK